MGGARGRSKAVRWQRPNIGSRMNREVHVRFWERPEVKALRATRHSRRFRDVPGMSGLPQTADISRPGRHFAFGPRAALEGGKTTRRSRRRIGDLVAL